MHRNYMKFFHAIQSNSVNFFVKKHFTHSKNKKTAFQCSPKFPMFPLKKINPWGGGEHMKNHLGSPPPPSSPRLAFI